MSTRRQFITLLGGAAAAWPVVARAQKTGKIGRIGFLRVGPPPAAFIDGFRQGLRELGLVEGQHFVIEYALAQSAAQVPNVAAELVSRRLDIVSPLERPRCCRPGTPRAKPLWCLWLP